MSKLIKPLILILGISFICLSGCVQQEESKEPQKDIIGKWVSSDKSLKMEFRADGKMLVHEKTENVTSNTESVTVFLDQTHLLGTWSGFIQDIYEVHIYGNRMTLDNGKGKEIKLRRVE